MRVGIPVRNGHIFGHFGQAETFLLVDIENGEVVNQLEVDASHTGGHAANVAFLKEQEVTHVIALNIGEGALGRFAGLSIPVTAGVKGDPVEAAIQLAKGTLVAGENKPHHHHHDHDHHHHHD